MSSLIFIPRKTTSSLGENDFSLLFNEDRTLNTFTGSQGNPAAGEGKHNLNTAVGGEQVLGFANVWTVSMWLKPTWQTSFDVPGNWRIDLFNPNTNGDGIIFEFAENPGFGDPEVFSVAAFDRDGRSAGGNSGPDLGGAQFPFVSGQWSNVVLTWDSQFLTLWIDGTNRGSSTGSQLGFLPMQDVPRGIFLGKTDPNFNIPFRGNLGHIAMWNTALNSANVNEIFNPSTGKPFDLDLNTNSGNYTASANLVQYWKPGALANINQFGNSFKSGGGHNLQNGSDLAGLTAWTVQIPLTNRVNDVPA